MSALPAPYAISSPSLGRSGVVVHNASMSESQHVAGASIAVRDGSSDRSNATVDGGARERSMAASSAAARPVAVMGASIDREKVAPESPSPDYRSSSSSSSSLSRSSLSSAFTMATHPRQEFVAMSGPGPHDQSRGAFHHDTRQRFVLASRPAASKALRGRLTSTLNAARKAICTSNLEALKKAASSARVLVTKLPDARSLQNALGRLLSAEVRCPCVLQNCLFSSRSRCTYLFPSFPLALFAVWRKSRAPPGYGGRCGITSRCPISSSWS